MIKTGPIAYGVIESINGDYPRFGLFMGVHRMALIRLDWVGTTNTAVSRYVAQRAKECAHRAEKAANL